MNGNTFRTLEFEAVRHLLLSHTGSAAGRARVASLRPATEPGPVRAALAATGEAAVLLRTPGRQPYHDLPDPEPHLRGARVEGYFLEAGALADVASFIEGGGEIARRVARAEGTPTLAGLAAGAADLDAVAAAIRRAVQPGGELRDEASPKLAETRRAIVRLRAQLESVMESFLHGKDSERLLQDRVVTTRSDRYVLLVKAEHRGALPGIIHGSSGSGASLFVEPLPAVELNNDIVSLQDEERREVVRILTELTRGVGEHADELSRLAEILGELDALQARALLARDMDAAAPEIADGPELELLEARHPLLMPHLSERLGLPRRTSREPVPVTLRVGFGVPVLVISGPNTGGKTVALKTVGLLALMAQSGLHVPAAPGSRLPVFRRVFADIGDEQSIAADLSTFSAHLATIVEMTRDLATPALVLLDEVGAGTDPTEGGALGVAIVEHFRRRGAMVVATTHHGLMKAYAQSSGGVAAASFGYDPHTYEPTYRLTLGAAGRSLALEMAERLGLPGEVVADARSRRDEKEAQAEALLKRLEQEQSALERDRARLDAERRRIEVAGGMQEGLEREAAARRRAEAEAFSRELRRRSEDAARKAADAVAAALRRFEAARATTPRAAANAAARARTEAVRAIRQAQEEALAGTQAQAAEPEAPTGAPVEVGARVKVQTLGVTGELIALADDQAEVAVAGKRLRVPRAALVGVARPAAPVASRAPAPAAAESESEVPAEINVVGLTVDEAVPRVDKLLDDAVLSQRKQVRVIHGFGAGKLRRAVAELLEGHPHVAAYRSGGAREGGGGVTIVELRE